MAEQHAGDTLRNEAGSGSKEKGKGKGKKGASAVGPPPKARAAPKPKTAGYRPDIASASSSGDLAEQLRKRATDLTRIEVEERDAAPTYIMPLFARFGSETAGMNILTYGDSLTAGYHSGSPWEPYGKALSDELACFGSPAEVHVCGHPGRTSQWLVEHLEIERCDDVPPGLARLLEGEEIGAVDLVMIMSGTNDLGIFRPPPDILESVAQLHAACSARGIASIVLQIPPSLGFSRAGEKRDAWKQTNRLVRERAQTSGRLCVDIESIMPWTSDDPSWDLDGLHFSPEGSQKLGKALAPIISDVLKQLRDSKQ